MQRDATGIVDDTPARGIVTGPCGPRQRQPRLFRRRPAPRRRVKICVEYENGDEYAATKDSKRRTARPPSHKQKPRIRGGVQSEAEPDGLAGKA